jgi:cobalt/nickel transport system permease protein
MHTFSEHFVRRHILSGIDSRVKILVALAILTMILTYKGFFLPLFVTSLCVILCVKMKVPLKVFLLRFSEPLLIIFVIVVLKFLFSGQEALFSFRRAGLHVAGYRDGLIEGLMIAARILSAVSVVAIVGFSTPFTEVLAGLTWLKVPKGFIEILLFAYRYIFVLFEDGTVIYNAQKNRLGYTNMRRGLRSFGTLTGTMVLKAFDHSQSLATSMVQRGYDGNVPMLKSRPLRMGEVIGSILVVAAMVLIWRA